MTDYSNACIYKIVCKDTNVKEIYVGSTTNFRVRLNGHKSSCCNKKSAKYNYKSYEFIRNNGGWDNWEMVKIKDVINCLDRYSIKKAERELIDELKPSLNITTPNRTTTDWRNDNKDRVRECCREATRRYRKKKLIQSSSLE
tara:strand:+ start:43 stop:468 length:426 start_codon:yes stop_codon:yes gene_type:complete